MNLCNIKRGCQYLVSHAKTSFTLLARFVQFYLYDLFWSKLYYQSLEIIFFTSVDILLQKKYIKIALLMLPKFAQLLAIPFFYLVDFE